MKLTKDYYRNLKDENNNNLFLEAKNGNLSTFRYIHGGIDFTNQKNRLARGLTLDEKDNVVLVGFEKFFCLNQLDTRDNLQKDFINEFSHLQPQDIYNSIEKLDGTLIILGVYNDTLITSTTSTTLSDYSKCSNQYFRNLEFANKIKDYLVERNSCFVFEFVSPINKIAVNYDTERYVLLAEISKENFQEMKIENCFNFDRPQVFQYTLEELKYIQENQKDIEGFVVYNQYNRKIKVKTKWWYEKSKAFSLFNDYNITKKDIKYVIDAIKNDEIDDLYSFQNSNKVYKQQNKIGKIEYFYNDIINKSNEIANKYNTLREMHENEKSKYTKFASMIKSNKEIRTDILTLFILQNYLEKNS